MRVGVGRVGGATLSGLGAFLTCTQGRLEDSPTLGFVAESLWDSGGFEIFRIFSVCGRVNFIELLKRADWEVRAKCLAI
jgi:hypothetical protein